MRNILFSMLVLLLSATALTAQTGADALKAAKKAFDSYSLNQDGEALKEAADMIQVAMKDGAVAADPKALLEAGDIYSGLIANYIQQRVVDPSTANALVENAAVLGAKAYMEAFAKSEKKGGKKAALKGLTGIQGNVSNEGIYAIQDKNYEASFEAFQTSVMLHNFLKENGGESALDEAKLNDEKYYAGLSAILLEKFDDAEVMFKDLYDAKYDDSGLYDGLYKVYSGKGDMKMAGKFLAEGREKFPEETNLLFTEINYYLAEGRLDELTDKLQEAINKEPDNVSLYATLGQVYEQLYNKANEEGDEAKATDYFNKAQSQYETGLTKDAEATRLIYSLGALIYNRGAAMTQELIKLGDDYSKEGQKKYDAMKAKVDAEFNKALPYFQKAEMSDPNDLNTLIALKEMFARNSEFETSNEFKARIEKIQAGEKVEKSYFKEKGM
ncbi:tetratricopeptide repeat protein [Neolewinella agarilytica]|uniref:Tetratricopeptide repeat-containing protein n=1 Tax=Neolewinella agarilytica TaxID=478744 RepID=A0A1H8YXM8_9BACT|nr:hypothetical protein [Neolewinella agarilytica]SEP56949.1 hypothetical protein SAMN05444359_10174 [Neolewinella agarilytica]